MSHMPNVTRRRQWEIDKCCVHPTGTLPRRVMLRGFFLALMPIKLAEQVLLCDNSITIISGWSKEFPLALGTACHCGNCAFEPQNDEDALCHDAQCDTVMVALPCREGDGKPVQHKMNETPVYSRSDSKAGQ